MLPIIQSPCSCFEIHFTDLRLQFLYHFFTHYNVTFTEETNTFTHIFSDKIIVQTGLTIGEYVVTNEQTGTLSITPPPANLQSLPQTNTTDYVLNWVSDQQIKENSYLNSMGSVGESLDSSTSFDCPDESLVESDGNNDAKRYDPKCITFRKVLIISL